MTTVFPEELKWAQFVVVMVFGLMLLSRYLSKCRGEGLLVNGRDPRLEGMLGSDIKKMALTQTSSRNTCRDDTGSGGVCGDDIRLLEHEGMVSSAEPPVFYPGLSNKRDMYRASALKATKQDMKEEEEERRKELEKAALVANENSAVTEGYRNPIEEDLRYHLY